MTSYRSSFTLVAFDLLLHELLPFAKISFSGLSFVIFWHIELKFHVWICLDIIQVKLDFGRVWPTFTWVIALFKKFVFRTFLCHLLTYWVEISFTKLSWHNTGQVWLWLHLTYFDMSYCPLQKFSFPYFLLLSWNIDLTFWYMNFSWHNTDQVWLLLRLTWLHIKYFLLFKFPHFLCHLARYWHQMWDINLYWHNTENFSLLYPFMYSFWSYASLLLGPVGDMYCFSNTYSMLVFTLISCSFGMKHRKTQIYNTHWNTHGVKWHLISFWDINVTMSFLKGFWGVTYF